MKLMIAASLFAFRACDSHTRERLSRVAVSPRRDIMTTTNGGGDPAPATREMPSLSILVQYSKDFSFENPNAPQSLMQQPQQPHIGIQINVNPRQMSNTDFEVELKLEGKAEHSGNVLFAFDLNYARVFRLTNIPQE